MQELIFLIQQQKHRTIVLWAFKCVEDILKTFEEEYPLETRPRIAFNQCQKWAKFLLDDTKCNKEKKLWEKKMQNKYNT